MKTKIGLQKRRHTLFFVRTLFFLQERSGWNKPNFLKQT